MKITDRVILKICFKYFSFSSKKVNELKKLYYKNALYEGETREDGVSKRIIKEGLGIYITNKGECYFGEFENDSINGEGNYFFLNGSFLRGSFVNNKLEKICILIQKNGDIFLLNFKNGNLQGFSTYFPVSEKNAYVILFEKNNFKKIIKKFLFSEEKYEESVLKIIKSTFENSQLNQILYTEKDIENVLKKNVQKNSQFICSYLINNKYFYCGIFNQNLTFNGLGILFDFDNERIKVGEFLEEGMENLGMIIEKKYAFIGRLCKNKLTHKILIKNLETFEFKLCQYEEGVFKSVLFEGIGNSIEESFDFSIKDMIFLKNTDVLGKNTFFIDEKFDISIISSLNFNFDSKKFKNIKSEAIDQIKNNKIETFTENDKNLTNKSNRSKSVNINPKILNEKIPLQKRNSKVDELKSKSKIKTPSPIHKNHCWDFDDAINKDKKEVFKNYFKKF
jgi:hypothetical protein